MSISTRLTIHDLAGLPEDDGKRYELIEGELHVTTQPHLDHQAVVGAIHHVLLSWSRRSNTGRIWLAPGVIFSEDEAVAPDLVWVARERLAQIVGDDGKLHAAPDLAVEVLSPGAQNESRDRKIKPARYAYWGVKEYWLVDRFARRVEVYRLEGASYTPTAALGAGDEIASPLLPGFACVVGEFFADLG
jgi:Uma2 family endonuclease